MRTQVNNLIDEFLQFGGIKSVDDFKEFIERVNKTIISNLDDSEAAIKLESQKAKKPKTTKNGLIAFSLPSIFASWNTV